ncbi:MAG TPA: hypothetical protein VKM72_33170 [Thermoanaerobaculia bacterium]|nr:hypothetical protein [Thermoanaerobaculia bacterium]
MTEIDSLVGQIDSATDWNARAALIRKVPELFGLASHSLVYARIAKKIYVPNLAPDFAYVHWRDEYELAPFEEAYEWAFELTAGFTVTDVDTLTAAIRAQPRTLKVFRLLLGLTAQELAAATEIIAARYDLKVVGSSRIKGMEAGAGSSESVARCCALTIDEGIRGELFGEPPTETLRPKIRKPDTLDGWATVQRYATDGVPLAVFLHQRHYGGAFRQLLDATSTPRGDILEDAVEELFFKHGLQFIRTGSDNQEEIARRFGVTVKPAPDFVVFDSSDTLRALLECKAANDGGTARDKAARFSALRDAASRLGGVPVFAVLAGLGWKRTKDALGPVVRDTDGRVFTLPTLTDLLDVQPFPGLVRK